MAGPGPADEEPKVLRGACLWEGSIVPKDPDMYPRRGLPLHSYSFRMGLEPEKSYSIGRGGRILRVSCFSNQIP